MGEKAPYGEIKEKKLLRKDTREAAVMEGGGG